MGETEFNWGKYQRHMRYTDEELNNFKSDARRADSTIKLFSREIAKKCLIIEVVESHGCTVGLKPGNRLYFRGLSVLDLKRSDPWCISALGFLPAIANMVQDRYVSGLDPNDMVYNHVPCMDVGSKSGWGQVIMKAYVVDEEDQK